MTSIDNVSNSLGANKSEAEALTGQLAASHRQAEDLRDQLTTLGAEGSASLANAAVQTIEGLISEATTLADHIAEAQTQVLAIKQDGLLTTDAPSVTSTPSSSPRRLEDFDSRRPDPRCMAKIKEAGWPTNRQGNTSARGYRFSGEGSVL